MKRLWDDFYLLDAGSPTVNWIMMCGWWEGLNGLTYKENVEDTRKSPARDLIKELKEYNIDVFGYDPYLSKTQIESFDVKPLNNLEDLDFDVDSFVFTVSHDEFKGISIGELKDLSNTNPLLVDVRGIFSKEESEETEFIYKKL